MDDFILNGYVNDNGGSAGSGVQYANKGSYRYGFNGKENDNEVKGEGNEQDYGMRIYDPRIARFLSIDPMTKGFPMLTPYQYASNNPIQNIDIDGLEGGAANGANTNTSTTASKPATIGSNPFEIHQQFHGASVWEHTHGGLAIQLFEISGGNKTYIKHDIKGSLQPLEPGGFTQKNLSSLESTPSGLEHNEYVNNTTSVFMVSDNTYGSGKAFSNWMLGNLVNGWGPETYEFGENNKFSTDAFGTKIFVDALTEYTDAGMPNEYHTKSSYGFMNQIGGLIEDKSVLTVENFLGSADIFFKRSNAKDIQIQIINVTSLTSADFLKHMPEESEWPKSTVAGTGSFYAPIPFRNVAQIFNKTLSVETIAMIKYWFDHPLKLIF